jgi:phage baseplate assembly protein V
MSDPARSLASASYAEAEIERRLMNLLRIGVVMSVDVENARARVKMGETETAALPWATSRAGADRSWWCPSEGEQVLVASPDGDLRRGVIVASLYSGAHPAPAQEPHIHRTVYEDGTVVEYDREENRLLVQVAQGGKIDIIASGGEVRVEADKVVLDTPLIESSKAGGKSDSVSIKAVNATIEADTLNLGGAGGARVARIGDRVQVGSGSSAGFWPIVEGSSKVKAV